jgi:hypothetical protein
MKKKKLKSLVKSARKTVRNDIKRSLITELTGIAVKLGQDSKKLNKEIEKGSKELAKKLAKDIKIDKAAIVEVTELINTAEVSETETTTAN